ncbi:MAG: hypothetical protein EZS28_001629 [Streblomastix strix]|uniref:Protein kinase domain-containing protein n=1 Tax=Streblomastix strix TaxID=222440 RepID=A0A5J4X7L0_9EUKA|nr:MAG: hypothetical protein EZS28_001629 [Streblomastix strix]
MEDTRILQSQGFQVRRDQNSRVYLVSIQGLGIKAAKLWENDDISQDGWKQLGAVKGEQNPFVVRYEAAKMVENATIVLMDFVNYKSLDYVIEQGKDLPPGTVRAILKQLLEGVRLMHKQGIVHGNITSENILLHSPPGSGRVILKITNIGLTKRPQIISYTNAKLIGGIFPNLAPEIIIGNGLTDSKSDVWSVGIIAHQLVAHEFPYKVQTFQELQNQMRLQPIIKPASIKDDQLWNLLVNTLTINPNNRFSAEQALNHSYFTGEQAEDEITNGVNRLARTAQSLQQQGDKTITVYDINPSFIISQSDIKKVTGLDPDIENPTSITYSILTSSNNPNTLIIRHINFNCETEDYDNLVTHACTFLDNLFPEGIQFPSNSRVQLIQKINNHSGYMQLRGYADPFIYIRFLALNIEAGLDGLKEGEQHPYYPQLLTVGIVNKLIETIKDNNNNKDNHRVVAQSLSCLFKAQPLPIYAGKQITEKLKERLPIPYFSGLALLAENPFNHSLILAGNFQYYLYGTNENKVKISGAVKEQVEQFVINDYSPEIIDKANEVFVMINQII